MSTSSALKTRPVHAERAVGNFGTGVLDTCRQADEFQIIGPENHQVIDRTERVVAARCDR